MSELLQYLQTPAGSIFIETYRTRNQTILKGPDSWLSFKTKREALSWLAGRYPSCLLYQTSTSPGSLSLCLGTISGLALDKGIAVPTKPQHPPGSCASGTCSCPLHNNPKF